MTYEEIKARLTQCEMKLQEFQHANHPARKSKNYNVAVEKLTILKESYEKLLKEAQETMVVKTKGGDTEIVGMDRKQAMGLKQDPTVTSIKTSKGQKIKEQDGVKFSKEETAAIAREVGKAVAKALHTLGDEVAHMKARNVEENSFEIYVQYKNNSDDQFSFYITDDTLHLVDFSFDKEIGSVGVKPSGEAIVHVDVLANELVKHFKSLANEGMSDQEYADAKEADRLEKHPERDTIKKIQALIAAQQKSEATKEEEEEYHKKLDTLTHKTFGKRKEELEEAPEDKSYIKVAVRDARKALALIDDSPAYSKAVEIDGSDTYYLNDKELAYDLMMDLGAQGIEVIDNNIDLDEVSDYARRRAAERDYKPSKEDKPAKSFKEPKNDYFARRKKELEEGDEELDKLAQDQKDHDEETYDREIGENEAEDQGGDLDIGHQDDEPDMLKQYVYDIATYAAKLYKQLDKYDQMDAEVDFPNWWQSKIILAKEYMSSAQHYLEFEEKQPALDALALEEAADKASYNKLKKEYDALVGKMKQLAQHFKTAEGETKAKIVAALKQHTARKRELENLIDQTVSGVGVGQELDTNLTEAKATCCGKCGRVHVKGTECKRPYLKGKDHCRYN